MIPSLADTSADMMTIHFLPVELRVFFSYYEKSRKSKQKSVITQDFAFQTRKGRLLMFYVCADFE